MDQVQSGPKKILRLNYCGRIIDHLGIQMYQSPVAAIAELVANAWDADAENVEITLPEELDDNAEIVIQDDGIGMSFEECQARFLNVGYARREGSPVELSPLKGRRILGRKGIGKFAGFGIAQIVRIETISRENGEHTVFEMDVDKLRSEVYVNPEGAIIDVIDYREANEEKKTKHGTIFHLKNLGISRRRDPQVFATSMARRFLLHQVATDFRISVNKIELSDHNDIFPVQFSFPADFKDDEKYEGLKIENGWGIETIGDKEVKWRVHFYQDPISAEDLRGISIFSGGKLVQAPFFFNITGGLPGQHGQQYISGQIQADFLDEQEEDLIAPERQRVNWEHDLSYDLQTWGQDLLRMLLKTWRDRRSEERERQLNERLSEFSTRLTRLHRHEQRTLSRALRKIAQIETLTQKQFEELGDAMVTAWEQGRLHDLIDDIAHVEELTPEQLINILAESQVLTALNTAEAVKTKLQTVGGLKLRIERHELENAVRDYISANPWLVSPQWETFAIEKNVKLLLRMAVAESGLEKDDDFRGRVDLALSSGSHLLILEFMRPGLSLDWDHINRFERYIRIIRENLKENTGGRFIDATGYIIADRLSGRSGLMDKIQALKNEYMYALDWSTLFENALGQWSDFLRILVGRNPEDDRLKALITEIRESF